MRLCIFVYGWRKYLGVRAISVCTLLYGVTNLRRTQFAIHCQASSVMSSLSSEGSRSGSDCAVVTPLAKPQPTAVTAPTTLSQPRA